MPKKTPPTETEQLAKQMVDQLLGSNPTPEQTQAMLAQLFAMGPMADAAGQGFGPSPIELPDPPATVQTFTIRVDLRDAKPPIWRLLKIPSDTRLDRVHEILQLAMGWTDSHLHHFELHTGTALPGAYFVTDIDEEGEGGTHESEARLDQVLHQVGDKLRYEYDFGDGWQHVLQVKAAESDAEHRVRCLGGRRACPPEDCGGVGGYEEILELLQMPKGELDDEARQLIEWLPDGFEPAEFDVEETNQILQGWQAGDVAPGGPPPPASLLPLVEANPFVAADLDELIYEAHLEVDAPEPSPELAAQLVRPWVVLLREIGAGLKLTGAGYLPPASVKRIYDELDLDIPWIGKANREDQTLPVLELRESAQALGLVRKRSGRLLPTAVSKRLVPEPTSADPKDVDALGLLRHLESRLPHSTSKFSEQASLLLLLIVAVGARPSTGLNPAADVLTQIGWRTNNDPVYPITVREQASITYAVLDRLHVAAGGPDHFDAPDKPHTPDAVRDLARRVLRD